MTATERLDKLLVERGLATTRHRAELLIKDSLVTVNGKVVERSGKKFTTDVEIELTGEGLTWVSRGALKLVGALQAWPLNIENSVCLDIGASTGGFTEVLLSEGASKVYAVDTGHGQLVEKLRSDERVINMEKTNIRHLESLPEPAEYAVIDVSFISLKHVFEALPRLLAPSANVITLIKPQFEVGRANLTKKGIVRSEKLYAKVIEDLSRCAKEFGLHPQAHLTSPIKGGDGNTEFIMHLHYQA